MYGDYYGIFDNYEEVMIKIFGKDYNIFENV